MMRTMILTAVVVALGAANALAQDPKVELSGTLGWTFSDGVNVGAIDDSPVRSTQGRFLVGPPPRLQREPQRGDRIPVRPPGHRPGGDGPLGDGSVPQSIYNYHGYFAYNFGDSDATVRPYSLGGLGATQYGSLNFTGPDGVAREVGGETQFSSPWALGLKMFPSPKFGLRLETRWTPTYIKTDPEGYWCDPYWGCYTVGEAEFSNQPSPRSPSSPSFPSSPWPRSPSPRRTPSRSPPRSRRSTTPPGSSP